MIDLRYQEPHGETPVLMADALRWWFEQDLPQYFKELENLQDNTKNNRDVRQALLDSEHIRFAEEASPLPSIGAVDAAYIDISLGEIATVLAMGFHVSQAHGPRFTARRVTGTQTEAFRHLMPSVRLSTELELIATAETPVIVDNSWWSFLMDVNKMVTSYYNLSADDGREMFKPIIDQCFGDNGFLMRSIYNPHAIAISKSGSSQATCKRPGISKFFVRPISDLTLYTMILEPGEYTKPLRIKEFTEGHFGTEKRGLSNDGIARLRSRFESRDGIHAIYYKPWPYKKAFRIEFGYADFCQPTQERFFSMLATIREETRIPTIIEPLQQFTADRLAKQVSSLAKMYGSINFARYPNLFFKTRT